MGKISEIGPSGPEETTQDVLTEMLRKGSQRLLAEVGARCHTRHELRITIVVGQHRPGSFPAGGNTALRFNLENVSIAHNSNRGLPARIVGRTAERDQTKK